MKRVHNQIQLITHRHSLKHPYKDTTSPIQIFTMRLIYTMDYGGERPLVTGHKKKTGNLISKKKRQQHRKRSKANKKESCFRTEKKNNKLTKQPTIINLSGQKSHLD